jgi:hypothetical protein
VASLFLKCVNVKRILLFLFAFQSNLKTLDRKLSHLFKCKYQQHLFSLQSSKNGKVKTLTLKTTEPMDETIMEWQQDKYFN